MTNEITLTLPFSEKDIDRGNFTASLIGHCVSAGLMDNERQSQLKEAFDSAFVEMATQFTKGESSTISQKRGELFYSSVLYQFDVFLLSFGSLERSVYQLIHAPVKEGLESGKRLMVKLFEESKIIYRRVFGTRMKLPVYEYRNATDRAFDIFCKKYSRYDARNINVSIDYPLLHTPAYNMKLTGVLFIREFYTSLMLENELCRFFTDKEISQLLSGYGRIYMTRYTDLVFNICQVVLNNMLAGAVLGKELFCIQLTEDELYKLQLQLSGFTKAEILDNVRKAFAPYHSVITNPMLIMYIRKYLDSFSNELYNHISNDSLDKFIVCENKDVLKG